MHTTLALLLEALATGAIRVQYGRITGRCGYVNRTTRTVVLNPDATPEQLNAELAHDLGALIAPELPRPRLAVLDGGIPDSAAPATLAGFDHPTLPALRVAE